MSKVTIRGRTYDLNDIDDLASIQNVLVSDNWPAKRSEGVRLFLSLQNMLSLQLKRHLAANFKMIMKTAMEEAESEGKAQVALAFNFAIDMTAPTVATIATHKLGYSIKHETKGKPMTHDLNQGEFLDDDMNLVLDVKGFQKENATPPPEDEPEDPKVEKFPAGTPAPVPGQDADGNVTAETQPGDTPPPKKASRKKKS